MCTGRAESTGKGQGTKPAAVARGVLAISRSPSRNLSVGSPNRKNKPVEAGRGSFESHRHAWLSVSGHQSLESVLVTP